MNPMALSVLHHDSGPGLANVYEFLAHRFPDKVLHSTLTLTLSPSLNLRLTLTLSLPDLLAHRFP